MSSVGIHRQRTIDFTTDKGLVYSCRIHIISAFLEIDNQR